RAALRCGRLHGRLCDFFHQHDRCSFLRPSRGRGNISSLERRRKGNDRGDLGEARVGGGEGGGGGGSARRVRSAHVFNVPEFNSPMSRKFNNQRLGNSITQSRGGACPLPGGRRKRRRTPSPSPTAPSPIPSPARAPFPPPRAGEGRHRPAPKTTERLGMLFSGG